MPTVEEIITDLKKGYKSDLLEHPVFGPLLETTLVVGCCRGLRVVNKLLNIDDFKDFETQAALLNIKIDINELAKNLAASQKEKV